MSSVLLLTCEQQAAHDSEEVHKHTTDINVHSFEAETKVQEKHSGSSGTRKPYDDYK